MRIKSLLALSLGLLSYCGIAQNIDNKVLTTVDGRNISAGEFIRMYNKSRDPGKKTEIGDYLPQFIIFKLKVADALHEGTDTTLSFRNELKGYRNQVAQNYLTDSEAREALLRKYYQRSLTEINCWHLLITVPKDATPSDTLKAWNKAITARGRIMNGEKFAEVAKELSNDPSVKVNSGNLGYFTVFQMIAPFEDAAYALFPGEISEPVRTTYGYHIIRVADKRPARGKLKVAHIMKAVPSGATEQQINKAESDINDIYNKLLKGASFSELAKSFSDHKESAQHGGELNWFGTGEIASDFCEAAFAISDTGTFTKPVRTPYGWHIIKLLGRKKPGSFEETKAYLDSKLNQTNLTASMRMAFIEKLKAEYHFKLNQKSVTWFVANTDSLVEAGKKMYDRSKIPGGDIFSFADKHYKPAEFTDHMEKSPSRSLRDLPKVYINKELEAVISEQLLSYENSMLETKYPEFRYLMGEFHDGMLLFDISGKKVWNRASGDSIALERYYNEHRENFKSADGIQLKFDQVQGEVMTGYQEELENEWIRQLKEKYTVKTDTLVLREIQNMLQNE